MWYRLFFDKNQICVGSNKHYLDFDGYYVASEDFYLPTDFEPIDKLIGHIYEVSKDHIKLHTALQKHTIRECTNW